MGKSGHIFTRQGVEGLALLIVTILSNECLPWIALSGLAPALCGGIKTLFIFDGDTETERFCLFPEAAQLLEAEPELLATLGSAGEAACFVTNVLLGQ